MQIHRASFYQSASLSGPMTVEWTATGLTEGEDPDAIAKAMRNELRMMSGWDGAIDGCIMDGYVMITAQLPPAFAYRLARYPSDQISHE